MINFKYNFILPLCVFKEFDEFISHKSKWDIKHKDYYYYVFSMITRCYIRSFHFQTCSHHFVSKNHWSVELKSSYLLNTMGENYNRIIQNLINWGFIGRGKHYQRWQPDKNLKGICKKFWFTEQYLTYLHKYLISINELKQGICKFTYGKLENINCTHKKLLMKLHKAAIDKKEEQLADSDIYDLYEHMNHFTINTDKSDEILTKMLQNKEINSSTYILEKEKISNFNDKSNDNVTLYIKKDKYGRVHTNVTNIKSDIRKQCMLCDGERVAEIDIKSSQGAFLYNVLYKWLDLINNKPIDTNFVKIEPFWYIDKTEYIKNNIENELNKYHSILENKQLYEWFESEVEQDSDISCELSRDIIKKEFLSVLFSKIEIDEDKHPIRGAIRRTWSEHFPTLLMCIDNMKLYNYASIAYEMQKTESNFVFNYVCKRINNEIHCHFCTIHDSIVVPEKYAVDIKKIFDDELIKMNIPTTTKLELSDIDNLKYMEIEPELFKLNESE